MSHESAGRVELNPNTGRLTGAISEAIRHAPMIEGPYTHQYISPKILGGQVEITETDLASLKDDDILSIDMAPVANNEIAVDSTPDFRLLLRKSYRCLSSTYPMGSEAIEQSVQAIIEHELEHLQALQQTTQTLVGYCFVVSFLRMPSKGNLPFLVPSLRYQASISKIALAYSLVAPKLLSPSDEKMIDVLGYPSKQEIMIRAKQLFRG